jgi:hypothetical protein
VTYVLEAIVYIWQFQKIKKKILKTWWLWCIFPCGRIQDKFGSDHMQIHKKHDLIMETKKWGLMETKISWALAVDLATSQLPPPSGHTPIITADLLHYLQVVSCGCWDGVILTSSLCRLAVLQMLLPSSFSFNLIRLYIFRLSCVFIK